MSTALTSVDMWAEQITLAITRMAPGTENAPRLCESFEFFNKHSTDSSANKSTINYNWLTRGRGEEIGQGGCYCQPISYRCFVSLTGKGKVEKGKKGKRKAETSKKRKPKTVKRKLLPFRAACLINRANTAAHAVATLWQRCGIAAHSCPRAALGVLCALVSQN